MCFELSVASTHFETTAFTGPQVIQLLEDSVGFRRSQIYLIDSFIESCKVVWS